MAYENFYEGGKSDLDPGSDNLYTGATMPQGSIGATTGAQTANQIQDVANYLNQGMKVIELSVIQPDVFEMIPKQHFKEINRLTKITGAETTLHAPMIEASGFTQQGWSEQGREASERQFKDVIFRAHELSPDKPMPVTIHASVMSGSETMPANMIKNLTPEEKAEYGNNIPTMMVAINQETGQPQGLIREEEYETEKKEAELWTPEKRLKSINSTDWINALTNLEFYKKEADESIAQGAGADPMRAQLFLNHIESSFRGIYHKARKYGDPEAQKVLDDVSNSWKENAEMTKGLEPDLQVAVRSKLIGDSIHKLANIKPPEVFKKVETFAIEKASDTFSNVAVEAYKKFGSTAPIISIENPPYSQALSTAEDLKKLVEVSRNKFAEKISKEKGIPLSEAKNLAKNAIGVTWDTSHISMIRKQGYEGEELIEQAKKIAPFVKHVHLNDNFGTTHTDLPPGMGTAELGNVIKELQKKGYKGKAVFEGGQFFNQFKRAPHVEVIEAMGSPMYSAVAEPTWRNSYGTVGTYSSGYGNFLPEQHFSMYGGGFSGLPTELGGAVSGRQSRLSGTPMN